MQRPQQYVIISSAVTEAIHLHSHIIYINFFKSRYRGDYSDFVTRTIQYFDTTDNAKVNVGLQALMMQIIQTVIVWVFLVLLKCQTWIKSFTPEDGGTMLLPIYRYLPTRLYGIKIQ